MSGNSSVTYKICQYQLFLECYKLDIYVSGVLKMLCAKGTQDKVKEK